MKILPSALLLFVIIPLISCSPADLPDEEKRVLFETETESGSLSLYTGDREYRYTDRIPFYLEFTEAPDVSESGSVRAFLEPGISWGDFKVYSVRQMSLHSFEVLMLPLSTGTLALNAPSGFPFDVDARIPVDSVLEPGDEGRELSPLLEEEQSSILFISLSAAGALTAAGLLVFVLLKKKKKSLPAAEEPTLAAFLEQTFSLPAEQKDSVHYRELYRLLLKDLAALHTGVSLSAGPVELIEQLEGPSPLNQWALRELYPFLEELERAFFAPSEGLALFSHQRNRDILYHWVQFVADEKKRGAL
ncbi:MAG: hypothetical protein PQJ58_07705 [Spirochaetales bacterium]|nr:hypothetical protein [Spirochaetales bacterium]